jgi:hypothetical protein
MIRACNPSTEATETERSRVQGQPGLCSETVTKQQQQQQKFCMAENLIRKVKRQMTNREKDLPCTIKE